MPPLKLLLRGRDGVSLLNGPSGAKGLDDKAASSSFGADSEFPASPCVLSEFSKCGRYLAQTLPGVGIEIRRTDGSAGSVKIADLEGSRVQRLAWSPRSTFLVTWHPFVALEDGADVSKVGNLRVYDVSTGDFIKAFSLKKITSNGWPYIQWSADESLAMQMVTNEIHVFDGKNIGGPFIGKIASPGITAMAVSPSPALPIKVAMFTPEAKGRPGNVRISQFPPLASASASKSFFEAQDVTLDWAPDGSAVLISTSTDVDATGASYYGSTGLYLLHADGSFDASVALQKGPISDAKWSPSGKHFVVISGSMPAEAVLFDGKAKPLFSFGAAHRSVVSFSPHGRFLCLAGFGNLAGDMDFWDTNKNKKIGSSNAHCAVTYGWSPDSRFFMTATCAPRSTL